MRIITLASTVLIKSTFQKISLQMHKEANLTLTLSRSRSSWDHHLNKLGRPHIPNATYQVSRSLAFWFWRKRFLKGFYHIWAWWPSLSCDQNILYKFWLTYHKESSHEIWVQLGQLFVRKLCLIYWWDHNMSDLSWKGKGQPWPLKLLYSRCLISFNISSKNNDFGFNSIQKSTFLKISH